MYLAGVFDLWSVYCYYFSVIISPKTMNALIVLYKKKKVTPVCFFFSSFGGGDIVFKTSRNYPKPAVCRVLHSACCIPYICWMYAWVRHVVSFISTSTLDHLSLLIYFQGQSVFFFFFKQLTKMDLNEDKKKKIEKMICYIWFVFKHKGYYLIFAYMH